MQLIGLLDSPYVRRVAISFQLLELRFEHRPISVFRNFDEFRAVNPVVKAPTLVCDDGEVLMDSTLILDYAEALAAPRSLVPSDVGARLRSLRLIGLALAAVEKSIQIYYERELRPPAMQYRPWVERVTGQCLAGFDALEAEVRRRPPAAESATIDQAGVTTAVVWHFSRTMIPDVIAAERYPALAAHSSAAERLAEFRAAPHGLDTYPVGA